MKRKKVALIFLIVANIILLAHAVLPHHHHDKVVCVESSHCQTADLGHKHSAKAHSHQHDTENSNCCVLKQAVAIPANQTRNETECDGCSVDHSFDTHFTLTKIVTVGAIPEKLVAHSVPDFSFWIPSYIAHSLGLRAPPTV